MGGSRAGIGPGISPKTSDDTLLGGRVRLRQPREGYRAAIDPVLLAAAVPAMAGQRVLDVGAGAGAAMLCLARRVPGCRVVGLELQPEAISLAEANIRANGLHECAAIVQGDIAAGPGASGLDAGGFDEVMSNPPHLAVAAGPPPPDAAKAASHVEAAVGIDAWLDFCLAMVRPKGGVTLIHRADRLPELMAALAGRAGGIVVFPLWPKAGVDAKRVILRARKGVATPARLAAGLVLHEVDGRYTAAAEAVLREGARLEL